MIQRFDDSFTTLWETLAPKFALAVRRDAAYLNWKYVSAPHVRYCIAALRRDDRNIGYAVYRHLHEPRGRVTLLVDFLADPDDETALQTLLHWVDREARQADSDKIRTFAMHAGVQAGAAALRLLPGEVDDGVRREGQRRRRAEPAFYENTDALARDARRLGPGSMTRCAGRPA